MQLFCFEYLKISGLFNIRIICAMELSSTPPPCDDWLTKLPNLDCSSLEMFQFLLVRRLIYYIPVHITPCESSEFVEEIGKSVLKNWFHKKDHFRKILKDDYPKYVNSREAFKKYASMRCIEIYDDFQACFADRLLKVTAFILEMACFCWEAGHINFIEIVHKVWKEIFISISAKSFVDNGGWPAFHRKCALESVEYDNWKVETDEGLKIRYFVLQYIIPTDILDEEAEKLCRGGRMLCRDGVLHKDVTAIGCSKSVTEFPTYDTVMNEKVPPRKYAFGTQFPNFLHMKFETKIGTEPKCKANTKYLVMKKLIQ